MIFPLILPMLTIIQKAVALKIELEKPDKNKNIIKNKLAKPIDNKYPIGKNNNK